MKTIFANIKKKNERWISPITMRLGWHVSKHLSKVTYTCQWDQSLGSLSITSYCLNSKLWTKQNHLPCWHATSTAIPCMKCTPLLTNSLHFNELTYFSDSKPFLIVLIQKFIFGSSNDSSGDRNSDELQHRDQNFNSN